LADTTCASQERATPRCDFSRIAAGVQNHLFALPVFARDPIVRAGTDNSIENRAWQALGHCPNIQHEMLHRNAAHTRLGKKPSASQAFQQLPRAQTDANKQSTLQLIQTQSGATTAAEGPAGTSSTTCTSLIPGGPPSPSPLSSTTQPAVALPQQAAPTTMGEVPQERRAQQAPHHSIKHDNEQAGNSILQLEGGSTPAATTPATVRCSLQLACSAKLGTLHMHRQARDLPFGAGHVQANLVMDPVTANNKQKKLDDRGKLQTRAQAPETRQLLKHRTTHLHRPALDLPFVAGHEQANLAMNPMSGTKKQMNSDDREKLQECALASAARQQFKAHGGNAPHTLRGHEQARLEYITKPDNTQTTTTGQYTHSTLLKSSNRTMSAARRRQGQQLDAQHDTPSRRPQVAPPFPLTPAGEVIQPPPPALPPEAWPCECNTNKAKHPKRDKVFLNTTHY